MLFSLGWNEPFRRLRQGQPPKGMFYGNLPGRNGAKENFICGITKEVSGARREFRGISNDLEEGACIQKNSHSVFP